MMRAAKLASKAKGLSTTDKQLQRVTPQSVSPPLPAQPLMPCAHCGKCLPKMALHPCSQCLETFCTVCSTRAYNQEEDRVLCLDCSEHEADTQRQSQGRSVEG